MYDYSFNTMNLSRVHPISFSMRRVCKGTDEAFASRQPLSGTTNATLAWEADVARQLSQQEELQVHINP